MKFGRRKNIIANRHPQILKNSHYTVNILCCCCFLANNNFFKRRIPNKKGEKKRKGASSSPSLNK